jgi:hypothetical protein
MAFQRRRAGFVRNLILFPVLVVYGNGGPFFPENK